MGIAVEGVGHVVLKVRDLDEALGFLPGRARARRGGRGPISVGGRWPSCRRASTTTTSRSSRSVPTPAAPSPGTSGCSTSPSRSARTSTPCGRRATTSPACGVRIGWIAEHRVSQSIYVADPDGNMIELYVDADPAIWRADPTVVATAMVLDL